MEKREIKAILKAVQTKERTIEVVANSGQSDRMAESLPVSALDTKNFLQNPVVLWAHQYQELPIGKVLSLAADGDALVAKIQFAETDMAEDVWQLYQGGFLNAVSVGFVGKEYEGGSNGKPLVWKQAELLEISCVPVPADPLAVARRVKMLTLETEKKELPLPEKKELPQPTMPSVTKLLDEISDTVDWLKCLIGEGGITSEKHQEKARQISEDLSKLLPQKRDNGHDKADEIVKEINKLTAKAESMKGH